jgi:hypothetical protein
VLTNTRLEDLIATLESDRRIRESSEMAVSADGGTVTLRGNVESFCQRRAAAQDAGTIDGVYEVVCVARPGARRPTPSAHGQAPARNSTATSSLQREGANR